MVAATLLAGACGGGGGLSVDPLVDSPTENVLSSCEPAGDQETTTLVETSDELPSVASMEEVVSENPDAEFIIEQLQDEGKSHEDALHTMYAQVVGQQLFADVQQLPGFVTGAYARPDAGEPFQLSFSGSGDETAGTGRIDVIDATPEQVGVWEQAVEDPSRWCLVLAPRSVPYGDSVIADARQRTDRQDEVLSNQKGDGHVPGWSAESVNGHLSDAGARDRLSGFGIGWRWAVFSSRSHQEWRLERARQGVAERGCDAVAQPRWSAPSALRVLDRHGDPVGTARTER